MNKLQKKKNTRQERLWKFFKKIEKRWNSCGWGGRIGVNWGEIISLNLSVRTIMTTSIPKAQLYLDYKIYFGEKPPKNRISIIKDISKEHILYEIAALNYRLKPKNKIYIDNSFETQVKELRYFTMTEDLFLRYSQVVDRFTQSITDYPIIFNRQACLFAIEEIVNSEEIKTFEKFDTSRIEVWESILIYLLAVNFTITQIKEEASSCKISFESLNPKLIPLNELLIETDPIYTLYRGYWLIDYFLHQKEYSAELITYFHDVYGIEPQQFIFHLMKMYMANNQEPDYNFFYCLKEGTEDIFERLSKRVNNKETYKLISIRKYPFINVGKQKYLISDNNFLLEKAYTQFINDFWFDWIKLAKDENGKSKFNMKLYRGEFGYFFENYLSQALTRCFENYKYSILLMFDQLKIKTTNGDVEIADLYLRCGNKILLGQVKSGSIYDAEKFGGSIEELYKNSRNEFFENFGVNQLIVSLTRMDNYIQIIDPKFPQGHSYEVYPCIIVNDKAFQTPLMADTFNSRFQELLINYDVKKVSVKPLALIHINDIERLEEFLNRTPSEIWNLLRFNFRNRKFIPPFYNTINQNKIKREYPERIMSLLNMYSPE